MRSLLLHAEVWSVGVGIDVIWIACEASTTLNIYGGFVLNSNGDRFAGRAERPATIACLVDLLGQTVDSVEFDVNHSLHLKLSGGYQLQVLRDNSGYESFMLSSSQGDAIVY